MTKLSEELDYRIRYDVEHNLFHAQNVFNDEYIKPTFIEYVQKLEKENAELKKKVENLQKYLDTQNCYRECAETWLKLTEAKEIIKKIEKIFYSGENALKRLSKISDILAEAEPFLNNEVEE